MSADLRRLNSLACAAACILALTSCRGVEQKPALPEAPAEEVPAVQQTASSSKPAENPFHVEARGLLKVGKLDGAVLALENALDLDPGDSWSQLILASLYLENGDPRSAAERYIQVLQTRSNDCIIALGLATARRRVDIAAGSEKVLRDILSSPGCPAAAYGAAVERLARHADDRVAGARLPEATPEGDTVRSIRILELTPGEPGFSDLADTIHIGYEGKLIALGDRFLDYNENYRALAHWVAEDTVLLDVTMSTRLGRYPDIESLNRDLDTLLGHWRTRRNRAEEYVAWDVANWVEFEDVRGRFRMDSPDRWFANLFQGPSGSLYTFAPIELQEPGEEPVRSGKVPAFDLLIRDRTEKDPPPWDDEAINELIVAVSRMFDGADHATEPWGEIIGDEPESLPGVLVKRTFIADGEVYRLAAAQLTDGMHMYQLAFAGPADKFDLLEAAFWRVARSLRPLDSKPVTQSAE